MTAMEMRKYLADRYGINSDKELQDAFRGLDVSLSVFVDDIGGSKEETA